MHSCADLSQNGQDATVSTKQVEQIFSLMYNSPHLGQISQAGIIKINTAQLIKAFPLL